MTTTAQLTTYTPWGPLLEPSSEWVTHVGWKPALPALWINHANPYDLQAAQLGQRRSEDTIMLKHYTTALTNKIYTAAAAHFGGDGIGQGTPDFTPALDACQKFRTP